MEAEHEQGCDCEAEPAKLPAPGRSPFRQPDWYEGRIAVLLDNLQPSMAAAHGVFDGPSIDFHQWVVAEREQAREDVAVREQFVKDLYGTLVAWGMHRMGPAGAKMPRFDVFRASLIDHAWPWIDQLWDAGPLDSPEQWVALCKAFRAITASTTNSSLVSTSKVLAHLLPKSVAVIDRQYTLAFLHQQNTLMNGVNGGEPCFQWRLFRELHERFFYPLVFEPMFVDAIAHWPPPPPGQAEAMHEAPLKAADSVIVGFQRHIGQEPIPGDE